MRYNSMKIIEVKDYNEMSKRAAEFIIEKIHKFPGLNLGLATGETPIETYKNMIDDHHRNGTSYQDVRTFNLDEYIGLTGNNKNSYRYFMNKYLFDHLDINKNHTHIPSSNVDEIQKECLKYEELIASYGGIDLQILGIGRNGHIGFNEPGTPFDSKTHIIDLSLSTREANARFFNSLEEVPTQAITMGISTIMKSKEILLLISGENKREALTKLLSGEINESFPASVLQEHRCITIIADEAAMGTKGTVLVAGMNRI